MSSRWSGWGYDQDDSLVPLPSEPPDPSINEWLIVCTGWRTSSPGKPPHTERYVGTIFDRRLHTEFQDIIAFDLRLTTRPHGGDRRARRVSREQLQRIRYSDVPTGSHTLRVGCTEKGCPVKFRRSEDKLGEILDKLQQAKVSGLDPDPRRVFDISKIP